MKRLLTDELLWILKMASPSSSATERISMRAFSATSFLMLIVSVTSVRESCELHSFSTALPDSTPCVKQANTSFAPYLRRAAAVSVRVVAVSTMSSTMSVFFPFTSPTRCISSAIPFSLRRLSTMAS